MEKLKKLIINIKWLPSKLFNRLVITLRRISVGRSLITYGVIFIRGTGK